MDDQEPAAAKPRSRTRLDGQAVLSLVPVVAIFYGSSPASVGLEVASIAVSPA